MRLRYKAVSLSKNGGISIDLGKTLTSFAAYKRSIIYVILPFQWRDLAL